MIIMERSMKESAREYAYRVIKHNIVSLELKPGSMVSENELADEMKISRTPVREALIELSKLKIVEIVPQKGSFIAKIDSTLVNEARYLRLIVEKSMVEMACDIATEKDIFLLEENVKLQDFYLANPIGDKQLVLDNEFHELLYKICNKNMTYNFISGMLTHFDRVRKLSLEVIKDVKTIADHKILIEAIKNKDKITASEVLTKHLTRYTVDEEELRKQYRDYFL